MNVDPELPPIIAEPPLIKPAKKRSSAFWVLMVFAILGVIFGGFLGFRVVQVVRYMRTHPRQVAPGEAEFREANRQIIAGHEGAFFGNTDEARAMAEEYSKSLNILRDNLFTKEKPTAIGSLEGKFFTYCQLNEDSCVFLVHVPDLRLFTDEAQKSLADLAWMNAQSVLHDKMQHPPKTVVVGVKGLLLYDSILIGDYVADPKPGQDGIRTRGSGLQDMKMFYPYFAAGDASIPAAEAGDEPEH
jgi:hypothetical protein